MKAILILYLIFINSIFISESQINVQNKTARLIPGPAETSIHYIKWYIQNQQRLQSIANGIIDGKPGDTTQAYKINFKQAEFYINELKKSGYVSPKYLNSFRRLFEYCAFNLKKYPQFDGPVEELEFDIVLGVQEDDNIKSNINKLNVKDATIHGNKAYVAAEVDKTLTLIFTLTKYKNRWYIDSYKPLFHME